MACLCIVPVYGTAGPVTRGELGDYGPDGDPIPVYRNRMGKGLKRSRMCPPEASTTGEEEEEEAPWV